MTIRVAAIEVSHWHALHDAAYLRHLVAMPDVELVAIQDSDAALVAKRAGEVASPPTFTDYRKMLTATPTTRPASSGGAARRMAVCNVRVTRSTKNSGLIRILSHFSKSSAPASQ